MPDGSCCVVGVLSVLRYPQNIKAWSGPALPPNGIHAAPRVAADPHLLAGARTLADIAEDFNLSGRGKSRSFSLRSVAPRPVRLKVECTKPLLDLAGQLLYVY